ncbi:hypothetical protein M7I_6344 [Glarea lozoyensis 74030]|uniref:Uncharacterized protein n=1 Tax=Glarea lozoyensis (strain ATCC 74030 / MF5533) TaxID=1104152 RepID=H0EUB1_GLAL7|nr:hypothetical protein M7I_6344 [Glarea lozoyensis 74030]
MFFPRTVINVSNSGRPALSPLREIHFVVLNTNRKNRSTKGKKHSNDSTKRYESNHIKYLLKVPSPPLMTQAMSNSQLSFGNDVAKV